MAPKRLRLGVRRPHRVAEQFPHLQNALSFEIQLNASAPIIPEMPQALSGIFANAGAYKDHKYGAGAVPG